MKLTDSQVSLLVYTVLIALLLCVTAGPVLFFAHMEAKTYNKVTGANVTTWDALWVTLRVDAPSKAVSHE